MTTTDYLSELYDVYQSIRSLPFRDRVNWLGDGNTGIAFTRLLRSTLGQIGNNEAAGMLEMLGDLRSNEKLWPAFDASFAALIATQ
jgi:hypothetical protein